FEGRFDHVPLAGIAPRPKNPIPIWMGGQVDAVLDRVGRMADGWFPLLGEPSELPSRIERIRAAAVEAGRDPAAIGIGPTLRLSGDLQRDVERAKEWEEAGATHLNVSTLRAGHRTPADHIDAIEDFKECWDEQTR